MGEIAKLTAGSNGKLDPKDYERTVSTLLAGGSDPVISKKPTGAWTHEITDLALKGNRKNIDLLIGDVVNEIGILNSNVTASNFAKLKNTNIFSKEDMSHAILNIVGEIIGTIGYLNAGLFGINNIHFLGRVSLNKVVKNSILERLKLANIKGLFEDNREYGTVIGALKHIETK